LGSYHDHHSESNDGMPLAVSLPSQLAFERRSV
jgi:hypothetical protein